MKALQFLTDPEPWPTPLPRRRAAAAAQPGDHADGARRPRRPAARWPTTGWCCATALTGICGSDSKQVLMDFERRRRQPDDRVHLVPPGARPRGGRHGRPTAGPAVARPRPRPAGRALPEPRLPRPRHHAGVPGVRAGRLLDLLELPRRAPLARHPHRQRGRGHRRLRRARCPPTRVDGVRGARRDPRRGRGARRPVVGVVPRHHPQPAAARLEGRRLRRRRARHDRDRDPPPALPRRRGGDDRPLAGPGRARPASLGATVFEPGAAARR